MRVDTGGYTFVYKFAFGLVPFSKRINKRDIRDSYFMLIWPIKKELKR